MNNRSAICYIACLTKENEIVGELTGMTDPPQWVGWQLHWIREEENTFVVKSYQEWPPSDNFSNRVKFEDGKICLKCEQIQKKGLIFKHTEEKFFLTLIYKEGNFLPENKEDLNVWYTEEISLLFIKKNFDLWIAAKILFNKVRESCEIDERWARRMGKA